MARTLRNCIACGTPADARIVFGGGAMAYTFCDRHGCDVFSVRRGALTPSWVQWAPADLRAWWEKQQVNDRAEWCASCRSWHPSPRDEAHAEALGCKAPRGEAARKGE